MIEMTTCPGPIFVLGRQHSGNTMVGLILGRFPRVYSQFGESHFFEHLARLRAVGTDTGLPMLGRLIANAAQPKLPTDEVIRIATIEQSLINYPHMQHLWNPTLLLDRVMLALARHSGKSRWAQKATSHIFYSEQIDMYLPGAKQIFMVRNPFDIAASLKRRDRAKQMLRAVWAWNRGVALALKRNRRCPESFLLIRYEDMVIEPTQTLEAISAFIGEPSCPDLLDIPHVNRSESPYDLSSEHRGIQSDRLWYFRKILNKTERQILARHVDQRLAEALYPELATTGAFGSKARWVRTLPAASAALWDFGVHQACIMWGNPRVGMERLIKRLNSR